MNVCEIFPSFQGEGVLAGVPQVFLRLGGCNLRCSYCDTPWARREVDACRVYDWRGKMATIPNPLKARTLADRIMSLWEHGMHSVSITGGEPLQQAVGLTELLPALRGGDMPVYLETNGTLPRELDMVLEWVDWVAMDLKLPYSQGGKDYLEAQRDFLRLASSRCLFLKVVIEEDTPAGELERCLRELVGEAEGVPLVLQPASRPSARRSRNPGGGPPAIRPERAAELRRLAASLFDDVRVIPQLHRAWGIR